MKNIIYKTIKRIIDLIFGLLGTIFLIPITIVLWCANLLAKDFGPVFFVQERIGENGKLYKLIKYRSMVLDADEKLVKYLLENDEANNEYKKYKKLKHDPRITPVGNFIRKTSLDESPQFINVLLGHMTLVGPRPYLPREIEDMGKSYDEIIKVKPGLTGLWQVSGRSDTTFEERLKIDEEYIEKKGLWFDIKIIFKTVFKVFRKEGAE